MDNLQKLAATFRKYSASESKQAAVAEMPEIRTYLKGKADGFELAAKWPEEELADMAGSCINEEDEIDRLRQSILNRTGLGRRLIMQEIFRERRLSG